MRISLSHIEAAIPERSQSIGEAGDEIGLSPRDRRMYARFFGLDRLPRDEGQSVAEMVRDACAAVPMDDLDLVIHSRTLLSFGPFHANTPPPLAGAAPAGPKAFGATMNHCAGGLAILEMLDALLPADGRALLVVSDKAFHPAVRHIENTTIMSDGAAALLVTRAPGQFDCLAAHTMRRGRYAIITGRPGDITDPGFAEEYVDLTAACIEAALARAGIRPETLRLILPHNVNQPSWDRLAARLGVTPGTVFRENIARPGHSFGADPFFNLRDAARAGHCAPGDLALMVSVGLGATASAAVLRVGDPSPLTQTAIERNVPCRI